MDTKPHPKATWSPCESFIPSLSPRGRRNQPVQFSTIWPGDWGGGFCHSPPGLFYQLMSRKPPVYISTAGNFRENQRMILQKGWSYQLPRPGIDEMPNNPIFPRPLLCFFPFERLRQPSPVNELLTGFISTFFFFSWTTEQVGEASCIK